MDSEDGLYADEDSAEEEVAHYLVGILQEQIPHPEVELQSAARTIRDLVRSSNALTKYYQRCLNRSTINLGESQIQISMCVKDSTTDESIQSQGMKLFYPSLTGHQLFRAKGELKRSPDNADEETRDSSGHS